MKDFLLNVLFPDGVECVLCNQLIDRDHQYLCSECLNQFDFIVGKSCNGCGKSLPSAFDGRYCAECMGREQPYQSGLACVTYDEFSAEAIWKFKYHHQRYIGRMMGFCMAEVLQATYIEDVDVVVPVPIYKDKERIKGYNHSAIIAGEIGRVCNKKVIDDFLIRKKATRPLKDLSRDERFQELKNVFEVQEDYKVLGPIGRKILLVDDIYTTGTTVKECCLALNEAGFSQIVVMTFATGQL
jgi:ComF family protein